jgi:hypothetical protein
MAFPNLRFGENYRLSVAIGCLYLREGLEMPHNCCLDARALEE